MFSFVCIPLSAFGVSIVITTSVLVMWYEQQIFDKGISLVPQLLSFALVYDQNILAEG